jgi:membrane protease YdiL (CAAX protease family)
MLGLLAAVGPGLAAVMTAGIAEGRSGVTRLLSSAIVWRVRVVWYLAALLFAPALLAATFALNAWLGAPFPGVVQKLPGFFPLLLLLTLQTGLGEELGWRGFAQRRLQPQWGLLRAALVVGAVWSAWHLPLFAIPGSMHWQLLRAAGALTAVGGYSLYLVFTAVLYALVMHASGSLLMPILMHGSTNATAWLFSLNEVAIQGVRPMLLLTALHGAVVLVWLLAGFIYLPAADVTHARRRAR